MRVAGGGGSESGSYLLGLDGLRGGEDVRVVLPLKHAVQHLQLLQQAQRAQVPDVVVGEVEFLGGTAGEEVLIRAAPTSCPLSAPPPPAGQGRPTFRAGKELMPSRSARPQRASQSTCRWPREVPRSLQRAGRWSVLSRGGGLCR